jgi:peptidyl-prolyl cis-trans isomerase C
MKRKLALLLLALAACSDKSVLAQVGDTKLRQADLDAFLASRPPNRLSREEALRELADSALIAEGARKQGLLDKAREPFAAETVLRDRYQKEKAQLARRRIHVAAIILRRGSGTAAVEQAKARAFKLKGELEQGADFAELAKKNSDDPGSAAKGGDLGPLFEGQIDPAFFSTASALAKGQTSQPIELPFAWFIVRALEDPVRVDPTFEEARAQLEVKARAEGETALLEKLRGSINVKLFPDRISAPPDKNSAP